MQTRLTLSIIIGIITLVNLANAQTAEEHLDKGVNKEQAGDNSETNQDDNKKIDVLEPLKLLNPNPAEENKKTEESTKKKTSTPEESKQTWVDSLLSSPAKHSLEKPDFDAIETDVYKRTIPAIDPDYFSRKVELSTITPDAPTPVGAFPAFKYGLFARHEILGAKAPNTTLGTVAELGGLAFIPAIVFIPLIIIKFRGKAMITSKINRFLGFIKMRFLILGLSLTVLLFLFPPWVERGGRYFGQAFLLSDLPCGYRSCSLSIPLLLIEIIIAWLLLGIAYKLAPKEKSSNGSG